jgi:hypothetical protein
MMHLHNRRCNRRVPRRSGYGSRPMWHGEPEPPGWRRTSWRILGSKLKLVEPGARIAAG